MRFRQESGLCKMDAHNFDLGDCQYQAPSYSELFQETNDGPVSMRATAFRSPIRKKCRSKELRVRWDPATRERPKWSESWKAALFILEYLFIFVACWFGINFACSW